MVASLLRLLPGPPQETTLAGLYLAQDLPTLGSAAAPFVYADFVCSLDGRIAQQDPVTGASRLPPALRNDSDFRLLLELIAQADCVITHSGYLRAIAAGELDDILQVGTQEATRDLADWRQAQGLSWQPAIAIASASLDFPMPPSLARHGQRVMIATGAAAAPDKVAEWHARGYEIIIAGQSRSVEGGALTRALGDRGFRSLFLLAGPRMLETMLRDGMLSRLYLTIVHRLLGGAPFHSLISGPELGVAGRLRLAALYQEATTDGGTQWFAQFETMRRGEGKEVE